MCPLLCECLFFGFLFLYVAIETVSCGKVNHTHDSGLQGIQHIFGPGEWPGNASVFAWIVFGHTLGDRMITVSAVDKTRDSTSLDNLLRNL